MGYTIERVRRISNVLGAPSNIRVALLCSGLGRVQRGFEAFTEALFGVLSGQAQHINTTVFQGGSTLGPNRVVVPNLRRNGALSGVLSPRQAAQLEERSFALAVYPSLRRGRFDVVHYNQIMVGSALFHLRRVFGGHFKLFYCDGGPCPPAWFAHRCDYAQLLTAPAYEAAKAHGIPKSRLTLLPYGLDGGRFSPLQTSISNGQPAGPATTRAELGIPVDAEVVLSVAALDREHKRIDYLIEEVAQVDNTWLLVAGQPTADTAGLRKLAEQRIPGRWRFITWPAERLPEIYRCADLFVLASLREGFGLVIVEAMMSGVPTVVHAGPVHRWVAGDSGAQIVDLSQRSNLARILQKRHTHDAVNTRKMRAQALERFDWGTLLPHYVEAFEQVAAGTGLCLHDAQDRSVRH